MRLNRKTMRLYECTDDDEYFQVQDDDRKPILSFMLSRDKSYVDITTYIRLDKIKLKKNDMLEFIHRLIMMKNKMA